MKKIYLIVLFLLSLFFQWRDSGVTVEAYTPQALAWGSEVCSKCNFNPCMCNVTTLPEVEVRACPGCGASLAEGESCSVCCGKTCGCCDVCGRMNCQTVVFPPGWWYGGGGTGTGTGNTGTGGTGGTGGGGGGGGGVGGSTGGSGYTSDCVGQICLTCLKFIPGTVTRGSNCPLCQGHEPIERSVLELDINKTELVIGEEYTLSVQTVSGNPVIINTIIRITKTELAIYDFDQWGLLYRGDPGYIPNFRASAPGNYTIQAKVVLNEGVSILTATFECKYPTAADILPNVQARMDAAWQETKDMATDSTWTEVGFVVYINTTGGNVLYETQFQYGPTKRYDPKVLPSIDFDYIPDKMEDSGNPTLGGRFPVAFFHTHPPLSRSGIVGGNRPAGPSVNDKAAPKDFPRWVYDYVGDRGIHRSTDPIDSPAQLYSFGGNQRQY